MARDHAEILLDIWDDPDWLALSGGAKLTYLMLLSQRRLEYSGVLYLNPARWASLLSPDATEVDVLKILAELESACFVVIDRSTNELCVRSFFRRDVAKPGKSGGRNANLIRSALDYANRVDSPSSGLPLSVRCSGALRCLSAARKSSPFPRRGEGGSGGGCGAPQRRGR